MSLPIYFHLSKLYSPGKYCSNKHLLRQKYIESAMTYKSPNINIQLGYFSVHTKLVLKQYGGKNISKWKFPKLFYIYHYVGFPHNFTYTQSKPKLMLLYSWKYYNLYTLSHKHTKITTSTSIIILFHSRNFNLYTYLLMIDIYGRPPPKTQARWWLSVTGNWSYQLSMY